LRTVSLLERQGTHHHHTAPDFAYVTAIVIGKSGLLHSRAAMRSRVL